MPTQNAYEVVMVFSLANGEEAASALLEKFKNLIEQKNGTISSVDEWGKRRLAYLINDEPEGYYVLMKFESEADLPAEINRVANITDGVLRTLIIK